MTIMTQDPVRDAEIIQFNLDKIHQQQCETFCKRVNEELNSLDTFKSFLHDIDYDDPSVQAIHGCIDGDMQDKAFGYDIMMNMFEEYCSMLVKL